MRHFTCVYLHAQTAAYVGDVHSRRTKIILIMGKTQFEPHAGVKMAQVLGSPLYICGLHTGFYFMEAKSEMQVAITANVKLYAVL